jgi:chromosome segregation ATPase
MSSSKKQTKPVAKPTFDAAAKPFNPTMSGHIETVLDKFQQLLDATADPNILHMSLDAAKNALTTAEHVHRHREQQMANLYAIIERMSKDNEELCQENYDLTMQLKANEDDTEKLKQAQLTIERLEEGIQEAHKDLLAMEIRFAERKPDSPKHCKDCDAAQISIGDHKMEIQDLVNENAELRREISELTASAATKVEPERKLRVFLCGQSTITEARKKIVDLFNYKESNMQFAKDKEGFVMRDKRAKQVYHYNTWKELTNAIKKDRYSASQLDETCVEAVSMPYKEFDYISTDVLQEIYGVIYNQVVYPEEEDWQTEFADKENPYFATLVENYVYKKK